MKVLCTRVHISLLFEIFCFFLRFFVFWARAYPPRSTYDEWSWNRLQRDAHAVRRVMALEDPTLPRVRHGRGHEATDYYPDVASSLPTGHRASARASGARVLNVRRTRSGPPCSERS